MKSLEGGMTTNVAVLGIGRGMEGDLTATASTSSETCTSTADGMHIATQE